MNSLNSAIALAASFATAHVALAQHTRVICEASDDYGTTWHSTLTVWPGQRVDVRVRFELVNSYDQLVLGFSGCTFQPVLTDFQSELGDRVVPFTFPGLDSTGAPTTETAYAGRHIIDSLGATGRLAPFGAGLQAATSASGLLTGFNDPGNVLRFAGSRNTTMMTNVAWGVSAAQWPPALTGPFFAYNVSPVVFRYAVNLGPRPAHVFRTMVAYVPFETISGQLAKYHICNGCASQWNLPVLPTSILSATIAVRNRCHADLVGNLQPNLADPSQPPRVLPNGSVTIDDLLYFLEQFEQGSTAADLDDGGGQGVQDDAVTIEDLLFFLVHYAAGC
jgi:hypothetical protein